MRQLLPVTQWSDELLQALPKPSFMLSRQPEMSDVRLQQHGVNNDDN